MELVNAIKEEIKLRDNGKLGKFGNLKNLARNPIGFRRWDEWLGVLHG